MKLQILVPRCNEPEETIKFLLDSIAIQQGFDFNNLEVLIGSASSASELSDKSIGSYSFSIKYSQYADCNNRTDLLNQLFDEATGEYIMYCNPSDTFLSLLALYTLMAFIQKGFDVLTFDFVEEIRGKKVDDINYFAHHKDDRFLCGKVYRRRHLIDNKVVWNSYVDDNSFNILAMITAKIREDCKIPLYIKRWDADSPDKDPLYSLKTYPDSIRSNEYLVVNLVERRLLDKAKFYLGSFIYRTYYAMNKPLWLDPMNAKYRYETEKCFKEYYNKNKDLFERISPEMRRPLIVGIKRQAMSEGVMMEHFTFEDWIDHIEELD